MLEKLLYTVNGHIYSMTPKYPSPPGKRPQNLSNSAILVSIMVFHLVPKNPRIPGFVVNNTKSRNRKFSSEWATLTLCNFKRISIPFNMVTLPNAYRKNDVKTACKLSITTVQEFFEILVLNRISGTVESQ